MNAALGTEAFGRADIAQSCNLGKLTRAIISRKYSGVRKKASRLGAPALADEYSICAIHQMGLYLI